MRTSLHPVFGVFLRSCPALSFQPNQHAMRGSVALSSLLSPHAAAIGEALEPRASPNSSFTQTWSSGITQQVACSVL